MELQSALSSPLSNPSQAKPSAIKPKAIKATGIHAIYSYHGLGPKKLGTLHSVHSLKRYAEGEFRKLQLEFQVEIGKIKASGIPLAQEITFSNIDQYIVDAVAGLEDEKQTLTHLRNVIAMHGRTICQIAEDLQEEIQFVTASAPVGGEVEDQRQ